METRILLPSIFRKGLHRKINLFQLPHAKKADQSTAAFVGIDLLKGNLSVDGLKDQLLLEVMLPVQLQQLPAAIKADPAVTHGNP